MRWGTCKAHDWPNRRIVSVNSTFARSSPIGLSCLIREGSRRERKSLLLGPFFRFGPFFSFKLTSTRAAFFFEGCAASGEDDFLFASFRIAIQARKRFRYFRKSISAFLASSYLTENIFLQHAFRACWTYCRKASGVPACRILTQNSVCFLEFDLAGQALHEHGLLQMVDDRRVGNLAGADHGYLARPLPPWGSLALTSGRSSFEPMSESCAKNEPLKRTFCLFFWTWGLDLIQQSARVFRFALDGSGRVWANSLIKIKEKGDFYTQYQSLSTKRKFSKY